MTKKFTYTAKSDGDQLTAAEWNNLAQDVDAAVDAINNGSNGTGVVSTEIDVENSSKTNISVNNIKVAELTAKTNGTNITVVGNNNINIEPREATGTGDKKISKDPANAQGGNIALKPGDDIELWAHHRGTSKNDEVSVKILTENSDGKELPAKLQLNTGDIVITSKDKTTDTDVTNITFNKAKNTRGYLKVRAQAIDLRCEDHGGIALQPKGSDSAGHENKIKFEHNGGDGKEFGTFNTEKTSIFTDEYRFNKAGTIYAVTRGELQTTYKIDGDPTSGVKKIDYPTQADDFKDIIDANKSCTWEELVIAVNYIKQEHPELFTANA